MATNALKKPFECTICKTSFTRKNSLARHKITLHSENEFISKNVVWLKPVYFECNCCCKRFPRKDSLVRHIGTGCRMAAKNNSHCNFECDSCGSKFQYKAQLVMHLEHNHLDKQFSTPLNIVCPVCEMRFKRKKDALGHLWKLHQEQIEEDYMRFDSKDDFLLWKKQMEESTYTRFITKGTHDGKDTTLTTYICHRSGLAKLKGVGKRRTKLKGSKKLNLFCPAEIQLRESKTTFTFHVYFRKTHLGHEQSINELAHIFLDKKEREELASRLAGGIPRKQIIKESRISNHEPSIKRVNLINGRDLKNIERTYNLKRNADPAFQSATINVETFVQEYANDILFFKPQNQSHGYFDDEDFVLIIMTKSQLEGLQRFGHDLVALDGTRGANRTDFQLHTLLVIDDFREWFAAAFAISNRNDDVFLKYFFQCIKEKISALSCQVLMTDVEEWYYDNWSSIMGVPEVKLFYLWHVREQWKSNITKIKNKEKQKQILLNLHNMLTDINEDSFVMELEAFVNNEDEDIQEFLKYFRMQYEKRAECWAYCFRINAGINTNMSLESFHKRLKNKCTDGKKLKDLCIVLKCVKDFLIEQETDYATKQIKGKLCSKLKTLRQRHDGLKLLSISDVMVQKISDYEWYISSFTEKEELMQKMYLISQRQYEMCNKCNLACIECNACFHMFRCSCLDYCVRDNMCKHIHYLCMNVLPWEEKVDYKLLPETHIQVTDGEEIPRENISYITPVDEEVPQDDNDGENFSAKLDEEVLPDDTVRIFVTTVDDEDPEDVFPDVDENVKVFATPVGEEILPDDIGSSLPTEDSQEAEQEQEVSYVENKKQVLNDIIENAISTIETEEEVDAVYNVLKNLGPALAASKLKNNVKRPAGTAKRRDKKIKVEK